MLNDFQTFPYMTMSEPLQLTLENLMSSVPAFHAKTSVWPGFRKALPKKQDQVFSLKSSESYAWYDQNSLSWKTWQRSLITDWTSYSGSFQKQGMMRNGQLYRAKIVGGCHRRQRWWCIAYPNSKGMEGRVSGSHA